MKRNEKRIYRLDEDIVEVPFTYDEDIGDYVVDYPDFKDNPRISPLGRKWVNSIDSDCPYADEKYGDCGSCKYFLCEKHGDVIGICTNEKFQHGKGGES